MALTNTLRGQRSERCPQCRLPLAWCFCTELEPPFDIGVSLILLRHPHEKFRSSGTGFLPGLCVNDFRILEPEELETVRTNLQEPVALLFPPDGFSDGRLPDCPPTQLPGIQTLIVPDGSWSEARRMVRRSEWLRNLPRVSPAIPQAWLSNPLRNDKWSRPCTAEAIGHWLFEFGATAAAERLKQQLQKFVEAHRKARGKE